MNDALSITNLLYHYGALMDAGDFARAADLLSDARVQLQGGRDVPGTAMRDIWEQMIILHPCGTPRTQHVITNPIVDIEADTARCQSCYTVLQQAEGGIVHVIAAGRYDDRFERVAGVWRFVFRDYSQLTLKGDLSQHLRPLAR